MRSVIWFIVGTIFGPTVVAVGLWALGEEVGHVKNMLAFVLGAVLGPVTVLGILYMATGKSERPPAPLEGKTSAMPWGALTVENLESLYEERRHILTAFRRGGEEAAQGRDVHKYSALALSGGGSNGAYGAGLLCGWSAAGTRPDFKVVTGVSTGALQATLAFLGPDHDVELKEIFTEFETKDILVKRELLAPAFQDALYDTDGLRSLIDRYATPEILAAVAKKHAAGHRLYVGTTNIETSRFVIWDMGEIASSGRPDALQRYRDVLLASASVPILFPPVYFPVKENGEERFEMHADGGTHSQVFFRGFLLAFDAVKEDVAKYGTIQVQLYVVRNGKLKQDVIRSNLKPRVSSIAARTVETLFDITTDSQLFRSYTLCRRAGVGFNLAGIPPSFPDLSPTDFDRERMLELFEQGYADAENGYAWAKEPPGLDPIEREPIANTAR